MSTFRERLAFGIKYLFGAAKIQPGAVTERVPLTVASDYQYDRDPSLLLRNNDLYIKVGWIFSAVNAVAEYGAAQGITIERENGEDEEDIPNHPFERLLKKPNPLMSRAEFLSASFSYYQLAHNCYWWINAPTETGEPLELWIIPPGQIMPITDERLFISHYQYTPMNGTELDIPVNEVVHFKRFNPTNPFQGNGLYDTVKYQVNTDYGSLRNQAAIQTEGNGAPPGILAFAESHIDSDWIRIKAELADAARAMRRYLPLRGVGAGGVQWLPNALSDREMQVIEKRAFTRDEIYQIIAPGYLNMMLPNATEANAKTGKATFTEFVIYPMLNSFAEKISNDLLIRYGDGLTCEFDEVRTKDRALELQEQAEYAKTHTVEEVRKKYYKDKPLGDKRDNLLPSQVDAQVGDGSEKPIPAPLASFAGQNNPLQAQEQKPPVDEAMMESEPVDATEPDEMQAEMKRWRRVARKAIKAGKPVPEFVTDIIPPDQAAAIRDNLKAVKAVEDVDAAFVLDKVDPIMMLVEQIRLAREDLSRVNQPA